MKKEVAAMPATMTPEVEARAAESPLWRRLIRRLLAGFSSRPYPLLAPMCIWLPYPPSTRQVTRPQREP
jgi:hypothetical protein